MQKETAEYSMKQKKEVTKMAKFNRDEYKRQQEKIAKAKLLLEKAGVVVPDVKKLYEIIGYLTTQGQTEMVETLTKLVKRID